jgi:hypothetical protein
MRRSSTEPRADKKSAISLASPQGNRIQNISLCKSSSAPLDAPSPDSPTFRIRSGKTDSTVRSSAARNTEVTYNNYAHYLRCSYGILPYDSVISVTITPCMSSLSPRIYLYYDHYLYH